MIGQENPDETAIEREARAFANMREVTPMMTLEDWGRVALGFVLEDESWPVFYAWIQKQPHSDRMQAQLEKLSYDLLKELRINFMLSSSGRLHEG